MIDESFINTIEFLGAVLRLRELPTDRYRSLAFHAACFWDAEKLASHLDRMFAADTPSETLQAKPLPACLLELLHQPEPRS